MRFAIGNNLRIATHRERQPDWGLRDGSCQAPVPA
jgi:hypothetical protein